MVHPQIEFWEELQKPLPYASRLQQHAKALHYHMNKCIDSYNKQLTISPNSIHTLRRYSAFLEEVCNNVTESRRCTEQADDLEDMLSREFSQSESNNLFMFQKKAAVDATREDVSVCRCARASCDVIMSFGGSCIHGRWL